MNKIRIEMLRRLSSAVCRMGDVVEFCFVSRWENGQVREKVGSEFLDKRTKKKKRAKGSFAVMKIGRGVYTPRMESQFVGKSVGERFEFRLSPNERQEEYSEDAIHTLTCSREFVKGFGIEVGKELEFPVESFEGEDVEFELHVNEEGNVVAKVIGMHVDQSEVVLTLDFNAKNADQDLIYQVRILKNLGDVRDPNEEIFGEEIEEEEDEMNEFEEFAIGGQDEDANEFNLPKK
jgi:FKBP-type peptidyl-prolyl cis-trans isomerase 2